MNAAAEFFAPTADNCWDFLFADYAEVRAEIERIATAGECKTHRAAMGHFLHAANRDNRGISALPAVEDAIRDLDAAYWQRAIQLTDVMDYMPAAARDQWNESIRNAETAPFDPDNVRATMAQLLAQRADFLADMVDGIFRGLSGEHVTNRPEGFYKRMIIAHVDNYGSFGSTGLIQDLRKVVAMLTGRGKVESWRLGPDAVRYAQKTMGQWVSLDGGAVMLRTYLKGTAHLQVHPQVAWRLNEVLAHKYPAALPPQFRTRPARQKADPELYDSPLPWPVIIAMGNLSIHGCMVDWRIDKDKHLRAEVSAVLESLGGVRSGDTWHFPYPPEDVIEAVKHSGVVPHKEAHQYYPTPDELAARMVALANIRPGNRCLEPSAGTGAIARLLPREATTCVEIAALHQAAVTASGYRCERADFLEWKAPHEFDRIVMNPPYSQGRWKAHLLSALVLLAPGGRLVALLPASARNDPDLTGAEWHRVPGTFPGTSIEVVICVINGGPKCSA